MIATKRARARDFISVRKLGPEDAYAIAEIRLYHPGGIPSLTPALWFGAFEDGRLIAAFGALEVTQKHLIIVEIDRVPDHWGTVGSLVLMRNVRTQTLLHGVRLQALIPSTNEKLKTALREIGAAPVCEIWESQD